MTTNHLTEDELQQYAMDSVGCASTIRDHILLCEDCKAKAASYQLLFSGINQQPAPVFDFDLQQLVLAQLPAPAPKTAADKYLIYIMVAIAVILAGIAVYLFRSYLATLFLGSSFIAYIAVTTIITILLLQAVDVYSSYQQKMKALDFQ
jgi:hypothetical protein